MVALLLVLWQQDRIHEVGTLMSVGVLKRTIFV